MHGTKKRCQISKVTLKKEKVRGIVTSDSESYGKSIVIKRVWHWNGNRHTANKTKTEDQE